MVLDAISLRWADEKVGYENYFGIGYGGNVRIPKGLENDPSKVDFRDGNKTIKEYTYSKNPILNE